MPNWCENILTVSGPTNIVNKFFEDNKSTEEGTDEVINLSFEKLIPTQDNNNWYQEHCDNWGTKWDACDVELSRCDTELHYSFNTAWGPPESWLKTVGLIHEYHDLEFVLEYLEPGCDFQGELHIKDSNIIKEENWVYSEYLWNNVGYKVIKEVSDELTEWYDFKSLDENVLSKFLDHIDDKLDNFIENMSYEYEIYGFDEHIKKDSIIQFKQNFRREKKKIVRKRRNISDFIFENMSIKFPEDLIYNINQWLSKI